MKLLPGAAAILLSISCASKLVKQIPTRSPCLALFTIDRIVMITIDGIHRNNLIRDSFIIITLSILTTYY